MSKPRRGVRMSTIKNVIDLVWILATPYFEREGWIVHAPSRRQCWICGAWSELTCRSCCCCPSCCECEEEL